MKTHTSILRFDFYLRIAATAILLATTFHSSDAFSQDSPLPPTISPVAPPLPAAPPPLQMQPLNQLPGQINANQNQAGQAAGAAAPIFSPRASASRSAVSQSAFSPNMIGDGFGPTPFSYVRSKGDSTGQGGRGELGRITTPGGGGAVGTTKIAENTSPIPRDRVFFNYSDFNGVPLIANGVNVNRFTPGFEKTFFQGMSSIELRAPFASTLSSNLYTVDSNDTQSTQFGNFTIYLKQLFYRDETFAFSGGLGMALPTANNENVFLSSTHQLLSIKNQAVHLLPFLGSVYTPSENVFVQQFLQFDFDSNGANVLVNDFNGNTSSIGRLRDMSYLYYSIGAGYWLYNNPNSDRLFTRIAPIAELHYNKSISSTNVLSSQLVTVGEPRVNQDLLNGTLGMSAMMGQNKTLTLAYVTPLSSIDHRLFNSEVRVIFNWYFGAPLNRITRVQF